MPSFRRRASVIDTDKVEEPPKKPEDGPEAAETLALAEAEAAEAEALAEAARARARAIRLRREAEAAEPKATNGEAADVESAPTETAPEAETGPDAEGEPVGETEPAAAVDEGAVDGESDTAIDESEEATAEASAPSGRRWGRILKVVAMSLAILCTGALLAASGYMVWQHREAVDEQQLKAEYAAAGRQSVVTLMSLDFNKAQENVQSIIDNATGDFKTDFESQAADFVKVAQDSKVVTDVNVTSTAVDSMDQDSAVVLVAATSHVTNAAGAKQEPRAWRLSVDLQKEGGQIKMSKVEFVP